MRVLFDQGTPAPLREALAHHDVSTTYERGWSEATNGELLDAAERDGFDVRVTTDSSLRYQQDLAARGLAVVVLLSTSWPRIQRVTASVIDAVDAATAGSCTEVRIP